jgi:putative sterol carrier protein
VTDVLPLLEKIKGRLDDPTVQAKLLGFSKSLQLVFPDLNETYVLNIVNGKSAVLEKKSVDAPDIAITWNSDVFTGIQNKTVDPTAAFMSGKLKVKGSMEDLLRLQTFMI